MGLLSVIEVFLSVINYLWFLPGFDRPRISEIEIRGYYQSIVVLL